MAKTPAGKASKSLKPKKEFSLPKKIKQALPAGEREGAEKALWDKSGGLCSLCGRPLDPTDADVDHQVALSHSGATTLSNLYLAHKACNRSRGNLEFKIARPVVEFRAFAEEKKAMTFDDVLDRYVVAEGRKARLPVSFALRGPEISIEWDGEAVELPTYEDPATRVRYFFADVPVVCIQNDVDVQPRVISYPHVRALAVDFASRPVHEPSNCRLVSQGGKSGALLQFDGQHKTTGQILLGRKKVPVKIYIEPDVAMIQALVLKIQQEIKKQPLTKSDTLAKLGDVIKRRLDEYLVPDGRSRTEVGFIEAQSPAERKGVKKEYESELLRLVFFDDSNELAKVVRPGSTGSPTTDKVVIERIIRPLIFQGLLDTDMDAAGGRDTERELVILVLNTIAQKMLPPGWNAPGNSLIKRRAENFFYQASIGWWMSELIMALRYVTQRLKTDKPLFVDDLAPKQQDSVVEVVERLCDLPKWSTEDPDDLKAMRSNTVKNVEERFRGLDYRSLLP